MLVNTSVPPILYTLPDARSKFSDDVHDAVALIQFNVLSDAPAEIVIPPPLAVVLLELATLPKRMFLSATVTV